MVLHSSVFLEPVREIHEELRFTLLVSGVHPWTQSMMAERMGMWHTWAVIHQGCSQRRIAVSQKAAPAGIDEAPIQPTKIQREGLHLINLIALETGLST